MNVATISLKLRESAQTKTTLGRLSRISGIVKIEQVFPGETDPELASLYLAKVKLSLINQILKTIQNDPDVEFAELPPKRKLM